MTSLLDQFRVPRLREYWVRWALRGVHYADRAGKLDLLYVVEDPWRMESAREQARFAWTNGLIAAEFSPLETMLEIGSGEGHQSQHLSRLCARHFGIDVSARAVRRALRRRPAAISPPATPSPSALADMPRRRSILMSPARRSITLKDDLGVFFRADFFPAWPAR